VIYEVKNVHGEPREWSSSHGGTFLSYTVDFINEDGVGESGVEWTKKPESRPPQVGEKVVGHIEPGKFAEKFKLDFNATRELGQGGGSSSEATTSNTSKGSSSKGEVDWDCRNAEIRRQHSQEMALRVYAVHLQANPDLTAKVDLPQVAAWADWFDQDAITAGQKASQGQLPPPTHQATETQSAAPEKPSAIDFSGARKQEPSQDLDDYRQLLWNAGLEPAAARDKVAEYMGVVLPADRLNKAISGLQDLDRQGSVLGQLKAETEQWIKGPLPQGDALDGEPDIPFHHPEYREPGYERLRWRF